MKEKNVVLYHRNCQDGSTAGFLMWNFLRHVEKDSELSCIAVNYNEEIPDIKDSNVYIVDFCYEPEQLKELLKNNKAVSVFDHHESAADMFGGYGIHTVTHENKVAVVKLILELSGCQIVREYIRNSIKLYDQHDTCWDNILNDRINNATRHIGQRDRWIFESEDTMVWYEMLKIVKYNDFETYYKILVEEQDEEFNARFEKAKNYYEVKESLAQKYARLYSLIDFAGHKNIPIVNVPSDFSSRVGEILYTQGFPFAIMYCLNSEIVYFSLRSDKNKQPNISVKDICKKFGGGGHINSAGFGLPPSELIKIFNNEYF